MGRRVLLLLERLLLAPMAAALLRGRAWLAPRLGAARLGSLAVVQNDARGHPAISLRCGEPNTSLPNAFGLVERDLKRLLDAMPDLVDGDHTMLRTAVQHFFKLGGKSFRPTIALLAASAANGGTEANERQCRLAQVSEMIHAASLLHDDVIDLADTRRGAKTVHKVYGNKVTSR